MLKWEEEMFVEDYIYNSEYQNTSTIDSLLNILKLNINDQKIEALNVLKLIFDFSYNIKV